MWPTFCGDGAWQGCADCGKKPSFTSRSSGEHRIKDPLTAQTFLFPSRIFSSGTQGLRFDGGSDVGKPSAPVALSLFSEGDMKVAAPMYVCCAECDCSGVDLGTCTKGSYDGPSYAIRSGGSCDMSYESDIAPFEFGAVGRITCDDEVEFKDSSCIIGALTNYADGENSLVVWEDSRVFGNITSRGSIEVRDGSRVRGVIQGEQDVDFGPNGYLEGSIKAGDDATVYSDSTVVYSGSGGSGGGSGAFSAGNWFDLGW